MNEKTFIKVALTYTPKNKLASKIIESLKPHDCSLCNDRKTANSVLWNSFMKAISEYNGRAELPNYNEWERGVSIEGVILINIYSVKDEIIS